MKIYKYLQTHLKLQQGRVGGPHVGQEAAQLAPEVAPGGPITRGPGVTVPGLLRLPGWREVGVLVGGGEAGGAEAEHEDAAGQQVLGHVEAEAGAGGGARDVVVPLLLGHHDQPEVDLHEGQGPEHQQHGAVAVPGGDWQLPIPVTRSEELFTQLIGCIADLSSDVRTQLTDQQSSMVTRVSTSTPHTGPR